MADCELLATCIFFNDKMQNYPFAADHMKQVYCRKGEQECGRYMVFSALGRENVPTDLFPNDTERAKKIIDSE